MEFPKMLYKGVKPNAFDQLEAEHTAVVQNADEEAQARKAGWHGFDEQPMAAEQAPKAAKAAPKADKAAEQAPKAAKAAPKADKAAEQAPKVEG